MSEELEGQLERITYFNAENHYTIAKIKTRGRKGFTTIVGNLVAVSPGEVLRLTGTWERHPKYGEQFKIISYQTVVPATVKGIEKYLGSGLIKGIGPVMAKRLVEKFGTQTLDLIENDINRLKEVEGFGGKRIEMISTAWASQKGIRDVMLFLQGHDVSSAYAAKIYRHYGSETLNILRENPYRLASDIFGIGFLTADSIAIKIGIPRNSLMRAEAGVRYVLQKLSDDGHVCYPHEDLLDESIKILDSEHDVIVSAIEHLLSSKKIIQENGFIYLAELHTAEDTVATSLKLIQKTSRQMSRPNFPEVISGIQEEMKIRLADAQKEAVRASIEKKLLVITGGPGTGKTTIIKTIITMYTRCSLKVLLAAPTGRAAKRLSETTGREAKTIHRLLEINPKQGGFRRNKENPLEADLLVIDEVSMVDTVLMHHLLMAVSPQATLILVGDVDQLPSVGPGAVLHDIIESGVIPVVRLNEIFRQSGESRIILNAHRINRGEFPDISAGKDEMQDFYFVNCDDPEKVADMILTFCRERIPAKFGYDSVRDLQVLTPMHRGIVGSANLNAELQKYLNPSSDELVRGGKTFKTGDKVMQIRNNYDKDVYNGDIGRIRMINREDHEVSVDFDNRIVTYDFVDLDEIVLAYAISVHKSQGSEYPAVVMPLLTQHYLLLQRNLLYTAITRGKQLVVIIGTTKALAIAIKNNKPQMRYTKLRERLIAGIN